MQFIDGKQNAQMIFLDKNESIVPLFFKHSITTQPQFYNYLPLLQL